MVLDLGLVDLRHPYDKKHRFLKLKCSADNYYSMGFLPNDDLNILVSSSYYNNFKIYSYSFKELNNNTTLWKYSQIYNIEEDHHGILDKQIKLYEQKKSHIKSFICQKNLFLINKGLMTQWKWKLEEKGKTIKMQTQYNLVDVNSSSIKSIVINKDQTLLALALSVKNQEKKIIDIYSLKNGIRISRYG